MKRLLFLLCWFLTGFSLQTSAGNILGAELTYATVAPNLYVINFKQVRDCSSTAPAINYNLQLSSPGCSALGRTVVLTQQGSAQLVLDYCPDNGNVCAPFTQPGIAVAYNYIATVTFSAAEQTCSDWYFGVTIHDNTRTESANVVGTPALYLEAFVKLGSNINNNSVFSSSYNHPFSTAFVNLNTKYYLNLYEPDGDSLAYSLKPALNAAGSSVTYKPGFSAQNPVVSSPASVFNPVLGEFQFMPNIFVPNILPAQGANRYATVFQIDEYRNINGIATKIGSVQRDMIFQIKEPDTTQKAPYFKNFTVNGQPWDTAQVLKILVGQTVVAKFETDDVNPGDSLTYTQAPNVLPFANFTITDNGVKPKIEMVLTPTLQHSWPQSLYFLPFRVQDDACPVEGYTFGFLKFEVVEVSGTKPDLNNTAGFTAFPNPFNDAVNFRFNLKSKAENILIYNLLGQQVDQIFVSKTAAGEQHIQWPNASQHASGTYIAKLITTDKTLQTLKFTKLQ